MNFLLGTLLIILFLFPGFLFRSWYLNVRHGRSFKSSFVEELLFSIVPTILIHLILSPVVIWLGFNLDGFYLIMINNPAGIDWIANPDFYKILLYCLGTYLLGAVGGLAVRKLAEGLNWDINIPLFRTRNEWYFVLSGFFIHVGRRRIFVESDVVKIDAVVELNKDAYIYRGTLSDFVLSKEDGIDRIYLSNVVRRRLILDERREPQISEESKTVGTQLLPNKGEEYFDERYYQIPGNTFVLPYREIKSLNITYVLIEEVPDS